MHTLLCAALAAWSVGSTHWTGNTTSSTAAFSLAPAGRLQDASAHPSLLWAGNIFKPIVYHLESARLAPARTPRGLCRPGRYGADGRPVSSAWGSRTYDHTQNCPSSIRNPGEVQ